MRFIAGNEGAGRNKHPLFRRIVSEKTAVELAKSPLAALKVLEAATHSAVRQFLRASFYHSAKIRLSAHFAPAGNLLGSAFPKPCLSSSRTTYHSFPRGRENSFIASLVLSPHKSGLCGNPMSAVYPRRVHAAIERRLRPCERDTTRPTAAAL